MKRIRHDLPVLIPIRGALGAARGFDGVSDMTALDMIQAFVAGHRSEAIEETVRVMRMTSKMFSPSFAGELDDAELETLKGIVKENAIKATDLARAQVWDVLESAE